MPPVTNIEDLRLRARRRIPRAIFDYADRGSYDEATYRANREDLAALMPDITVPTLMITGEQHSGWTPAQAAAAITTMRDGRAAVVPDAAYLVPLEQPEQAQARGVDALADGQG